MRSTSWKMRASLFYMELQMVSFCPSMSWEVILGVIFSPLISLDFCVAKARVHFQHSAELLNRLVKVEANYSLQLYPDEGHILRDPRSIQHFQRTVVNYFQSCLKHSIFLDPIEDDDEEDDWARSPLPSSWRTLLGLYAILCITLGRITRHKSTGVGTKHIGSPPATSGKTDIWYTLLQTIIFTVCSRLHLFEKILCGLEGYGFWQKSLQIF